MSKLKVLSSTLTEIATINSVLSSSRTEVINADNTLSFSMVLDEESTEWINDTNVIGLDSDYYDIAKYKKGQASDGSLTVSVDCEHISYRLNSSQYNVEYFTVIGTPAVILAAILEGTPFNVGTVECTTELTYSIQQAMSRKGLLTQFVLQLGGELLFEGFIVSILAHRGSTVPKDLTAGRNIDVISKSVDKTTLDEAGNYNTAYECSLIYPMELALGDIVTLNYSKLSIDITLRIVSITTNPYNRYEVKFSVSNVVPTIEDANYRLAMTTVSKDKLYNGIRIGPEYGFEAVRSDKKARAYYRSDQMAMQTGDGSGTHWENKLYYDYDSETGNTELYYNGKFTAEVIQALSAIITPNLYAEKATISELTVDQLDTSDKVKKFLSSDKTPDNFQRIYDQYHELVTASTDGLDENKVQTVNRNNEPLYWANEAHTSATTDETDYPVWTYNYTEQIKWKVFFYEYSPGFCVPAMKWGAGAPEDENLDSCLMYKLEGQFWIVMTSADGTTAELCMTKYIDAKHRRLSSAAINKTAGTVTVILEGEATPTVLEYEENAGQVIYTWPDGHSTTVSIA